MNHIGEIISLVVAVSWTITALFANEASRRLGAMTVNVIRMVFATLFLAIMLWIATGTPFPIYADGKACFISPSQVWLDMCLEISVYSTLM